MHAVEIADDTTLERRPEIVEADVSGTHILLNDELQYSGLDEIGQHIWKLLDSPTTFAALVTQLTSEFEVEPDECRADVASFLNDLLEQRLIQIR